MKPNDTYALPIEGLHCASCVSRVEKLLREVDGVTSAVTHLTQQTVVVSVDHPPRLPSVIKALAGAGYPVVTQTAALDIQGMSCASCVSRIEHVLYGIDGVMEPNVNLATNTANFRFIDTLTSADAVAVALTDSGYESSVRAERAGDHSAHRGKQIAELGRQTGIAAALALPVFVLEMGSHLLPGFAEFIDTTIGVKNSHYLQFVLTSWVLFGPGRSFYLTGIPALFKGAPTMNSLVALGTSAAYLFSLVSTFMPGWLPVGTVNVYYEAAAVIVVLILFGRLLEARAKGRTGDAIRKLMGLQAKTGRIERDNKIIEVDIDRIDLGDTVHVRPGERLPVDGIVVSGTTYIDESMVTGEPVSVAKLIGNPVIGGTVNGTGAIAYRATAVGNETLLAQIVTMVEQAQGAKLPVQALVDRISAWFVPLVMVLALLTMAVWFFVGPTPSLANALVAGVSVLIIACPCAMGLATPTSIMVGTGTAAGMGVLFRQGDALQRLQAIDVVALDKTGTLTQGCPELTHCEMTTGWSDHEVLPIIAAVEALSEHPISDAIVRAADRRQFSLPSVENFQSHTGFGVQAQVDGHTVLIGSDKLMIRENVPITSFTATGDALAEQGQSPLYAAFDNTIVAVMGVADPVKDNAYPAIQTLKRLGLSPIMITGDNPRTANAIANELGIDRVVAGVLPDEKVSAIERLKADGQQVAFVGDGINDAPALASANVGIALGTGTDVAIEAADVILMSGDLKGVVSAFDISQQTMRNIRQNLFWAFGYNALLIPVAAGILYPLNGTVLSPMLAAAAMALSSVFVLSNALRLRWIRPAIDTDHYRQHESDEPARHVVAPAR